MKKGTKMSLIVGTFLGLLFGSSCRGQCVEKLPVYNDEIAAGSFEPRMESLLKFECPERLRDAKFGFRRPLAKSGYLETSFGRSEMDGTLAKEYAAGC
jgi:hypothetical protein